MAGADGLPKLKPPATKNLIPSEYQRLHLHGTPANKTCMKWKLGAGLQINTSMVCYLISVSNAKIIQHRVTKSITRKEDISHVSYIKKRTCHKQTNKYIYIYIHTHTHTYIKSHNFIT
jgi:hypothetical protein